MNVTLRIGHASCARARVGTNASATESVRLAIGFIGLLLYSRTQSRFRYSRTQSRFRAVFFGAARFDSLRQRSVGRRHKQRHPQAQKQARADEKQCNLDTSRSARVSPLTLTI